MKVNRKRKLRMTIEKVIQNFFSNPRGHEAQGRLMI